MSRAKKGLGALSGKLKKMIVNLSDKNIKKMLEELGEYGVNQARGYITHIDTGETIDSINYSVNGRKLVIEAGGHAVWVEFGAGIIFNPSGYPGELPDGIVPIGTYGKGQGGTGKGWWYKDETTGSYEYTLGIQADAFMYKTAQDLKKKATELGVKLVNVEIKGES